MTSLVRKCINSWGRIFLDDRMHLFERWSRNIDVEFSDYQFVVEKSLWRKCNLNYSHELCLHGFAWWCQICRLESFQYGFCYCCCFCSWAWPFLIHQPFLLSTALIIWTSWWRRSSDSLWGPEKPFLILLFGMVLLVTCDSVIWF